MLKADAEAAGSRLAIALFPVRFQVESNLEDFRPQAYFRQMCESLKIECHDLLPELRDDWKKNQRAIFFDHCHYLPEGNTLVAGKLLAWLTETGLIPK
jgi:hypothetical protein